MLADGTFVQFPLGGYQYPTIGIISPLDFNYVWYEIFFIFFTWDFDSDVEYRLIFHRVGGNDNCPQYEESQFNYAESQEYKGLAASTLTFYQSLIPSIFRNVVPDSQVSFYNAYTLYDFASFQYTHNRSVAANVDPSSIAELRYLASLQEFSLNGNLSASGLVTGDEIRAVAGRTFAGKVLSMLGQNMGSNGVNEKLSLFFSGYEPFLAFFALSGLSRHNPQFQSLPEPGSLMIFELFSNSPNATSYPVIEQLWVRFLFRNGTDDAEPLVAYPLFGRGNSETDMPWRDFGTGMSNIMISDVGTWCQTCSSNAIFCRAFLDNQSNSTTGTGTGTGTSGGSPGDVGSVGVSYSRMSLVTAGVIGATVTIAVIMLLIATSVLCCGMRFYRNDSKRHSSLGGFKGAGKLASDADLTHTVARDGAGKTVAKHERVGSWELGNAKKVDTKDPRHESIDRVVSTADYSRKDDDDNISAVNPFGDPVKIDDQV
jgi:hypothetical protein